MFKIKNWNKYQHYGDKKTVPWIKLHYEILTGEDFSDWDNDSKLLAIVCMLVASRHDGMVPNNPKHIQRVGGLSDIPDFEPLIKSGFLQLDNSQNLSRQNQIESPESISSSNSSSLSYKNGKKQKTYSDEFLDFCKIYPPNRCPKTKSFESYQKSRKEVDHEIIIAGARSYADECSRNGTEIKFIAHASTWLNQRRWEIDYSSQVIPTSGTSSGRKGNFDDVLAAAARIAAREAMPELDRWENVLHG